MPVGPKLKRRCAAGDNAFRFRVLVRDIRNKEQGYGHIRRD